MMVEFEEIRWPAAIVIVAIVIACAWAVHSDSQARQQIRMQVVRTCSTVMTSAHDYQACVDTAMRGARLP